MQSDCSLKYCQGVQKTAVLRPSVVLHNGLELVDIHSAFTNTPSLTSHLFRRADENESSPFQLKGPGIRISSQSRCYIESKSTTRRAGIAQKIALSPDEVDQRPWHFEQG